MQAATGQQYPTVTQADIAAAPAALKKDLDNALRTAADEGRRRNLEFDRALVLGQWRGLLGLADKALSEPGCATAQWLDFVSAFGRAQQVADDMGRELECDPLVSPDWRHQVEAMIWAGEPELAVERGLKGMGIVSSEGLVASTIDAMIAAGRLDEAQALTDRQLRAEERVFWATITLAAARGDRAQGQSLLANHNFETGAFTGAELSALARLGDRETANRLASQIDGRPLGYVVLLQGLDECYCGAPFDLEATPKFAAMLEEAGMNWPPPSPIKFPLKTW